MSIKSRNEFRKFLLGTSYRTFALLLCLLLRETITGAFRSCALRRRRRLIRIVVVRRRRVVHRLFVVIVGVGVAAFDVGSFFVATFHQLRRLQEQTLVI